MDTQKTNIHFLILFLPCNTHISYPIPSNFLWSNLYTVTFFYSLYALLSLFLSWIGGFLLEFLCLTGLSSSSSSRSPGFFINCMRSARPSPKRLTPWPFFGLLLSLFFKFGLRLTLAPPNTRFSIAKLLYLGCTVFFFFNGEESLLSLSKPSEPLLLLSLVLFVGLLDTGSSSSGTTLSFLKLFTLCTVSIPNKTLLLSKFVRLGDLDPWFLDFQLLIKFLLTNWLNYY